MGNGGLFKMLVREPALDYRIFAEPRELPALPLLCDRLCVLRTGQDGECARLAELPPVR